MLTADTITDEQIRALRASAEPGDHDTIVSCNHALRGRRQYRERCAELLNARARRDCQHPRAAAADERRHSRPPLRHRFSPHEEAMSERLSEEELAIMTAVSSANPLWQRALAELRSLRLSDEERAALLWLATMQPIRVATEQERTTCVRALKAIARLTGGES